LNISWLTAFDVIVFVSKQHSGWNGYRKRSSSAEIAAPARAGLQDPQQQTVSLQRR